MVKTELIVEVIWCGCHGKKVKTKKEKKVPAISQVKK